LVIQLIGCRMRDNEASGGKGERDRKSEYPAYGILCSYAYVDTIKQKKKFLYWLSIVEKLLNC